MYSKTTKKCQKAPKEQSDNKYKKVPTSSNVTLKSQQKDLLMIELPVVVMMTMKTIMRVMIVIIVIIYC